MRTIVEMASGSRYPRHGGAFERGTLTGEVVVLRFVKEEEGSGPWLQGGCLGCVYHDDQKGSGCPRFDGSSKLVGRRFMCDHSRCSRRGVWVEVDPLEVDFRKALKEEES